MPKSNNKDYRLTVNYQKGRPVYAYGWDQMNAEFKAVDDAWAPKASNVKTKFKDHTPTKEAPWTHDLEYEYQVTTNNNVNTLQGHVHYYEHDNWRAVGGHFWVKGIQAHEGLTPDVVVERFADRGQLHGEARKLMNIGQNDI